MIDSVIVLWGQTLAYTFYVLVILLLMGYFGINITKDGKKKEFKSGIFYAFVSFLVVLGVSLHIITHYTIPWKPMDLERSKIKPDKTYEIYVKDHKFYLPEEKLVIKKNEKVKFNVRSADLTYGFGIFRADNSMVFQMQVLPGHDNDIIWIFDKPGNYSIRSTEYSGWKGINMILRNVVEVVN